MLQNICLTCKSNKTCCIQHIYTNSKMLSFQRQKLSSKLQNVQIISIEIFLQGNLWFKLWLGGYHCAIILRYLLSFVVSQQELKRFHLQIFIVCWSKWWTALSSNFSSRFHDAPITPITVFLQRKLLLACNPEMIVRCLLSSTVFHSVTARTAKNVLATLSQKSQKERAELCIKCDCQTT